MASATDLDLSFIENFVELFKDQSVLIIERLQPTCLRVIFSLMIIDLTLDMLFDQSDENIFLKFIRKIMLYGAYITFINQYSVLVNDYILKGFIQLGNYIATGSTSTDFITSPTKLVSDILVWLFPILTTAKFGQMGLDILGIESIPIGLMGLSLFLIGLALRIAVSMIMSFAKFYIISSCGIILLPFAVFSVTSDLGKKVLGMLIKQGVNLVVIVLVINMMGESLKFEGKIGIMSLILYIGKIFVWYCMMSETDTIVNEIFNGNIVGGFGRYGGGVQNHGLRGMRGAIRSYKQGPGMVNSIKGLVSSYKNSTM